MIDKVVLIKFKLKYHYDDDAIDRLNYFYTNVIIFFFSMTVAVKSLIGEPLQCWVPAQFQDGWEEYVENYCFVENTYWLQMDHGIPIKHQEREDRELYYYQWVWFVLLLQAVLFMVPKTVWILLNGQTGLSIAALIQTAFLTKTEGDEKKRILKDDVEEAAKKVAKEFSSVWQHKANVRARSGGYSKAFSNVWHGSYVTVLYLFVKLLYIVNVVAQFFILNAFLNPSYTWWGFGIFGDLMNGREWEESGHFPRVTMCDVEVRQLAAVHRWSLQCVLVLNMLNEKIYLFLWFWFLFVGLLTVVNFVYWLVVSFARPMAYSFVNRYLIYEEIHTSDRSLREFVDGTLHKDGVTVLRLISDNCGDIVTSQIVKHLWNIAHNTTDEKEALFKRPALVMHEKQPLMDDSDTSHEFQE